MNEDYTHLLRKKDSEIKNELDNKKEMGNVIDKIIKEEPILVNKEKKEDSEDEPALNSDDDPSNGEVKRRI